MCQNAASHQFNSLEEHQQQADNCNSHKFTQSWSISRTVEAYERRCKKIQNMLCKLFLKPPPPPPPLWCILRQMFIYSTFLLMHNFWARKAVFKHKKIVFCELHVCAKLKLGGRYCVYCEPPSPKQNYKADTTKLNLLISLCIMAMLISVTLSVCPTLEPHCW